jgi:excisionase family DNA binding protein
MATAGGPIFLRPGEVATIFGVNAKTVARWAREGKLPYIRTPGGHMRIAADAVRALAGSRGTTEPALEEHDASGRG